MTSINREELCENVHRLLDRLKIYTTKPTSSISKNGIYFWYEEGELRLDEKQRVTRVGSHCTQDRLIGRIKEHYGLNREGSSFRRHVGGALMNKNGEPTSEIKEWYKARRSTRFNEEKFGLFEEQVSEEAKKGSYRILEVNEVNERIELETRLISLFSKCKHCRPSNIWLGNNAYREEIRQSGLWNVDDIFSTNELEIEELGRLEELVNQTVNMPDNP